MGLFLGATELSTGGGGGGGFTKRLKWTTARGNDDANYNNAASYTVNPATDLGLADGASIGYFMCGGGGSGNNQTSSTGNGGRGGKIIYGTAIIVTASTNLVLTPGVGSTSVNGLGTNSTITGGLTLSTLDGGFFGAPGITQTSRYGAGALGINGYGGGGMPGRNQIGWPQGDSMHGWGIGAGAYNSNAGEGPKVGADGAILLYY